MKFIVIFVRENGNETESLIFAMIADSKEIAIESARKHLRIMHPDEEIPLFLCLNIDNMF